MIYFVFFSTSNILYPLSIVYACSAIHVLYSYLCCVKALLKQTDDERSDRATLSVEQQRDINIYNGFFIINCVMEVFCIVSDDSNEPAMLLRFVSVGTSL